MEIFKSKVRNEKNRSVKRAISGLIQIADQAALIELPIG